MEKLEWRKKLASRKFWIAVAGFVSGLISACGGGENTAATVSGCILQGAAVLGYLLAEGLTDAAHATGTTTIPAQENKSENKQEAEYGNG